MKSNFLLFAGFWCWITNASAQEFPAHRPSIPHAIGPAALWRPEVKLHPASRWERPIQAPQSLLPEILRRNKQAERRRERQLNRDTRLWSTTIGNTSVNNWSPYPDRALDARNITFPLPKKPQQQRK